ncbi:MAG: flagellar basal-body rod protein FlgF [Pseudomonadales bacterium]|nr:flagellar basal-body rod protein FlgF [Pseudomonadales bacterium]
MDKAIYIGMTGASQNMAAQAVQANNLANASTTGFRADLIQARTEQVEGEGFETRFYNVLQPNATDFTQGPLMETGNELDIAISGDGFLAVQTADGSEAYTRAGDLQLTAFGELVNGSGLPVIGNAGPIAIPPNQKIEIGTDGTISVLEQGQGAEAITAFDRIKLVNPDTEMLVKGSDGLLRRNDGVPELADGAVRVQSGFVEASNVNVVDAMVEMISLSRNFEMNIKLIRTAEENSEASAQLLQVR